MDTPDRSQIGTPISKFEDSPVFNYINSLSPIKPVKSIHIAQTFNSLSFASIPSVFTSPHVTSHKESRFLRRHQCPDPSKPEFSSDGGNKDGTKEEVVDATQPCNNTAEQHEHFDGRSSSQEASVEPLNETSNLAIELPQALKYDCGSPDCKSTPYCGIEGDCALELADVSAALVPLFQEASEKDSFEGQVHIQRICEIEQTEEGTACDWESLFSDAADLLIFNSPNGTEGLKELTKNFQNHDEIISSSTESRFRQENANKLQKLRITGPVNFGEQQETENPSTQPGEDSELKDINQVPGELATSSMGKCTDTFSTEKMDETVSNLHRGMRRRCLVFEMAGVHRKKFNNVSNTSPSMLLQSDEKIGSDNKQLAPLKPGGDSSRCIVPGIGLHLNALAVTPKDNIVVKHESLTYGEQPNVTTSTSSIPSPVTGQESLNKLSSTSSERDTDPSANGAQVVEDASQASAYVASEEFNQSSPKKKRRRLEHAGEDACKRCNCKKSKCLKLYCECFAAGVYCIEPCSCQDCFNKPVHEDTVLATRKQIESRNPLAFAPKVIRSSDSVPDIGDEPINTPASARHKRGCNCKKSSCLKKYCECYQGGVGCSINCRCEGCKNAFGRKDGSALIGLEAEPEEDENEKLVENGVERSLQKPLIQNKEDQNPDYLLPATPLHLSRLSVQLPFSSKSKLLRSSFLTIGSSSGLQNSHRLGQPNLMQPQSQFDKHFHTVQEDDMPEILRGDSSPSIGIKNASPNSKRVSPPHCDFGSSPGRRSSRKLILQSIPSFPSLTPQP